MQVICSPDSFKGALSAADAAAAMARGVSAAGAEADQCPIADGGEGTVDAIINAAGGRRFTHSVTGPLGESVKGAWAMLENCDQPSAEKTAVIEMAAASGLTLVPEHLRDPAQTTTFGTGELITSALDAGAKRIILGLGGSATCDGGCGAAQALGVRFYDSHEALLNAPLRGGDLERIARIDHTRLDSRLEHCQLLIACDVTNPLTGPNGAAHVYAPQKGATPEQVELLDKGLTHLASVIKNDLGLDIQSHPGAGAAGGFGGGAIALLGGQLESGIELILDAVSFDRRVADCDLCLTGEGQFDAQSLSGKAAIGVAKAAAQRGVPTIALVGKIEPEDASVQHPELLQVIAIGKGLSQKESIARTAELLESAARQVVENFINHQEPSSSNHQS